MMSTSRTILITGATDGIGKAAAVALAETGAHILVHGRNPQRALAAVESIKKESGSSAIEPVVADFASLKQVRQLVTEIINRCDRLDVLVNNAGVLMNDRVVTEDGFELTFQVNHLAHFLLTNLLLDLLKKSAPSRIINVSSMVHGSAKIEFDNLQGEKNYSGYSAYGRSKLANILFTHELAERLRGTSVTVNALHPGVIATKLLRAGFGGFWGGGVKKGAETIVYLATSPEGGTVTGKYFVNRTQAESSVRSNDTKLQKEFWRVSERMAEIIGSPE